MSIYARDYDDLPRDLFEVRNNSDSYTDYFEKDSAYLTPAHPLFKYFRFAAQKAQRHDIEQSVKFYEARAEKRSMNPASAEMYRRMAEESRQKLADLEPIPDHGQPTAEDLAEIDRQRMAAENARKAAEHEKELRQREAFLSQRIRGLRLIQTETEAHPITDGAPVVLIHWSEHPAFSDYADDSLRLSLPAADKILGTLDTEQNATRETDSGCGWYYKTKFTITATDPDSGEEMTYTGRYDLGDGEGGLIQHIRNFGTWYLTHDDRGNELSNPAESNDATRFADYLETFAA